MPARRDLSAPAEGRRPKAPQEGTHGGWTTACRLWGFDGAAAWVGNALAGVIGSGSTIVATRLAPRWRSTGRIGRDRSHGAYRWRRRGDSDAIPEARYPGRRQRKLLVRLGLQVLCRFPFFGAQAVHLRFSVCLLELSGRALVKLPPTIEGLRKLSCGSIGSRGREGFPVRSPRGGRGRQLGSDAVKNAPHRCRSPQLEIGRGESVCDLLLNRQGLSSQIEHVWDVGGQLLA
jgi:hypothetical protein